MKGLRSFLTVCLALLVFPAAVAVDNDDTARAAARHSVAGAPTQTNSRQNNSATKTNSGTRGGRGTTVNSGTAHDRAVSTSGRAAQQRTKTTTATSRNTTTRTVSDRNPSSQSVVTRTPTKTTKGTVARTAASGVSTRTAKPGTTTRNAKNTLTTKRISRAATADETVAGGISSKYSLCRQTFYNCMDEFCANKDSQLKRCACSSRYSDFDSAKKQLSKIENKMLDFNQRLLTVNMDAEDVVAMNKATEGEEAFYETEDKTASKKMLDDISKKLNKVFGEDSTTGMGAINLSLNADSAFDSVDSFAGSSTTTKSGVALYRAALPVCREMVLESCSNDELSLAESGYQMMIEQDCNTVSKAYQTKTDEARSKVMESNALLDISRLDVYQKRNSDDILTCKKKMLTMLTDGTVCGSDLVKCLDISGKYINPDTGSAVLTSDLADLATLITRPNNEENQTWLSAGMNYKFVDYLNDKKTFLEPATENCQDVADTVWKQFLPDALAQIKLAQDAKLEEIRRACTTLTTECLEASSESIQNFDARALSVFGVSADKTANTMCSEIKDSCSNLLNANQGIDTGGDWETGMSNIATNKTYETILSSCTQVGRNCIIQSCKSISGNFALCDDIYQSPNRHSILNRTACWDEVLDCVGQAGDLAINDIMMLLGKINQNIVTRSTRATRSVTIPATSFYTELYGNNITSIYDICAAPICPESTEQSPTIACLKCRIAERIWGSCEHDPNSSTEATNKILIPDEGTNAETLLSWFAKNTNTDNADESCVNTRCSGSYEIYPDDSYRCATTATSFTDHRYCPVGEGIGWDNNFKYGTDANFEGINFITMPTPAGNDTYNCCWSRARKHGNFWSSQISGSEYIEHARLYYKDNKKCRDDNNRNSCPQADLPSIATNDYPGINSQPYQTYKAYQHTNYNNAASSLNWGSTTYINDATEDNNYSITTHFLNNICCAASHIRNFSYKQNGATTYRELCLPSGTFKLLANNGHQLLVCVMKSGDDVKYPWYCEGRDSATNSYGECSQASEIWNDYPNQNGDYPHSRYVNCPGTLLLINGNNLYKNATTLNTGCPHQTGRKYEAKNYYYTDLGQLEYYHDNNPTNWDSSHGWFVNVEQDTSTSGTTATATSTGYQVYGSNQCGGVINQGISGGSTLPGTL